VVDLKMQPENGILYPSFRARLLNGLVSGPWLGLLRIVDRL
jgi:hypothetical protein